MEKQQLQLEYQYRASNLNDPKKAPLIIMLHGYGSDENDLFSFASELPSFRICAHFFVVSVFDSYNIIDFISLLL